MTTDNEHARRALLLSLPTSCNGNYHDCIDGLCGCDGCVECNPSAAGDLFSDAEIDDCDDDYLLDDDEDPVPTATIKETE